MGITKGEKQQLGALAGHAAIEGLI